MDQEVMDKDFKLFAKNVIIGFVISCEPLISHFVLDQYGVIDSDGLTGHFESDVGVRMFQNPYGAKVLF